MIPQNTHLYINETSVYKYIYKPSNDCIKMEITLFCVRSFQDKVCIMVNLKKVDLFTKKNMVVRNSPGLFINKYIFTRMYMNKNTMKIMNVKCLITLKYFKLC